MKYHWNAGYFFGRNCLISVNASLIHFFNVKCVKNPTAPGTFNAIKDCVVPYFDSFNT